MNQAFKKHAKSTTYKLPYIILCHWTSTGLYKINMHCKAESKGMLTLNYQTIEQAKIFSYPLFSLDT